MREDIGFELRGDYAGATGEDMTCDFKWEQFTEKDHEMWRFLYKRILPVVKDKMCKEHAEGIKLLGFDDEQGIPNYERVSDKLEKLSGWRLVTVPGYLPPEVFFRHLARRHFPVTTFIRKPEEVDYLKEPDIFHDMFGHVPLIANPKFAEYFFSFAEGGLKAAASGYTHFIDTLYWFTIEFGLINTPEGRKIYGAGIASSMGESVYSLSDQPNHIGFDLRRVMRQKYRIDEYQKNYFVIDSFEQLVEATKPDFLPIYKEVTDMLPVEIGTTLPEDTIFQKGIT
jgi:phenylalanine-4-hydroxylase